MSETSTLPPAPVIEFPDVLEDAAPAVLEQFIRSALVGPDAATDPAVARFVGSVLTRLADQGEANMIATYLAAEPGGDATYDVEVLGLGEVIATQRVGGLSVVDAVGEAAVLAGVDDRHVEVRARGANGLERRVLSARPQGPLEYVYPGLLSFDGGHEIERHALEAWEVQLARWRNGTAADRVDVPTTGPVVQASVGDSQRGEDRHPETDRAPQRAGHVGEVLAGDPTRSEGDEEMVAEGSSVRANGRSRRGLLEHNGHEGVAHLAWSAPDPDVARSPAADLAPSLRAAIGTAETIAGCVVARRERGRSETELAPSLRAAIGTVEAVASCVAGGLEHDDRVARLAAPLRSAVSTAEAIADCVAARLERDHATAQLAQPLRAALQTVRAVADCVAARLDGEQTGAADSTALEVAAPIALATPSDDRPPSPADPPGFRAPDPSGEDVRARLEEVCRELADLRHGLTQLGDDRAVLLEGAQAMVRLERAIEVCPPSVSGDGTETEPGVAPDAAGTRWCGADGGDTPANSGEPPALSEAITRPNRTDPVTLLDPRQVDELVDAVARRLRGLFEFVDDAEFVDGG